MIGTVARESGYRFRATFRRRWTGYLSLVVLVGLLGGVAMAAMAGARRTQSSFPTYIAGTHPSDLQMFEEFAPISNLGYSPRVSAAIGRIPHVSRAATTVGFNGTMQILGPRNASHVPGQAPPSVEGSTGGEYFSLDKVSVLQGRMADPTRPDELMLSSGAATAYGLHVGSTVRVAFFSLRQVASPDYAGYPTDKPHIIVPFKVVATIEYAPQIIQDDDAALSDQLAVLTPALTNQLENCCAYYSYADLQLNGGAGQAATVEAAVRKIAPNLGPIGGQSTNAPIMAKAERAIRPEAIAIGVFGAIAALAALIINAQLVSRLIRRQADEVAILRALGAGPTMLVADSVLGVVGALVLGALAAIAVAAALSPLAPLGPVRDVYPDRGLSFDWTVLGFGALLLVAALTATAVVVAFSSSTRRTRATKALPGHESAWRRAVAGARLSPAAALGIRSALGPEPSASSGSGAVGTGAPVRSALVGAVVAVVVIVTSLTFASSLNTLVSQPALYGWNWDYALLAGYAAQENLPAAETATLLDHDPYVSKWAGVYFEHAKIAGQPVQVLAMRPGASVTPSMLSGHPLQTPGQIVLGPKTFAGLHKRLGDSVLVQFQGHRQHRMRIAGTATLPTVGASGAVSLQMGTGAVMATSLFPPVALNPQGTPINGPMAVFIKLRAGVDPVAALRSLNHITAVLDRPSDPNGPVGGVVGVLRPAEITNYRTVSATPALLATVLAAGALAALGLTLVASVRARRRQFAVLKALGFTGRQLAVSIAWQSSIAAVIGVIIGIPVGIAFGRWLWTLFANGIAAVPHPTVPAASITAVALGAIAFANLVALFPARLAARTRTSALLRSE